MSAPSPTIVVHGGAGSRPAEGPDAEAAHEGCARAAALGYAILRAGGGAGVPAPLAGRSPDHY
jgi:hypothetical protein